MDGAPAPSPLEVTPAPGWGPAPELLAALWFFAAIQSKGIPWGDAPFLWSNAFRLAESWRLHEWASLATPHPPVGYLPLVFSALLLPEDAPQLASLLCLWLIGNGWRRWSGSAWPLAALLCSPLFWRTGWEYGWDLPASACILQALSWWHASNHFQKLRPSLVCGLWLALATLCKYTVPFFLFLPCLWAFLGTPHKRHAMAAGGLALLLILPWLGFHAALLAPYFSGSLAENVSDITLNGRSWQQRLAMMGYYPAALKDAVGWPGLLLLCLGWFLEMRRDPRMWMALFSALSGMVLLSCMPAAVDRYAFPALVLLLGGVGGLSSLPGVGFFGGTFWLILAFGSFLGWRQPALVPPTYQHPWKNLAWPESPSYRPALVETEALQKWLTKSLDGPAERVGLWLPFDGRLPDVGVFLWLGRQQGWTGELVPLRRVGTQLPPVPSALQRVIGLVQDEDAAWLQAQGLHRVEEGGTWTMAGQKWRMEGWNR